MAFFRDVADAVCLTLAEMTWQDAVEVMLVGLMLAACCGVVRRVK